MTQLEVAVRALEEIRDIDVHEDGDCSGCGEFIGDNQIHHNEDYPCGIASRALATIRERAGRAGVPMTLERYESMPDGTGTACRKCDGKGWYGADGAATPCNSVTCSAASLPGEAKAEEPHPSVLGTRLVGYSVMDQLRVSEGTGEAAPTPSTPGTEPVR